MVHSEAIFWGGGFHIFHFLKKDSEKILALRCQMTALSLDASVAGVQPNIL